MAFPASPTNGQQITLGGVLYEYDSTLTVWRRMAKIYSLNANNTTFSNLTVSGNVTIGTGLFWSNGTPFSSGVNSAKAVGYSLVFGG